MEISNFQNRLYRFKTPLANYGVLTSILTLMIQHVGISPVIKNPELYKNLTELRFDSVRHRFGCFFLHDLDVTNGSLPSVQEKDNLAMLRFLGIKSLHQAKETVPDQTEIPPSQDSLTWKQLEEHVNRADKRTQIRDFEWDPLWLTYSAARTLFCQFTSDYWSYLTKHGFKPLPRHPQTLQEAMETWTVKSARERMSEDLSLYLSPSVDGLTGNIPPKSAGQRFDEKRTAFFPEPEVLLVPRSKWNPFYSVGFVKDYHDTLNTALDGGKEIKDALDCIFSHLQILPKNPGKPGDVRPLWKWDGSALILLLNSSYLQLTDRNMLYKGAVVKERRKAGPKKLKSAQEVEKVLAQNRRQGSPRMTRAIRKATAVEEKQLRQGRKRGRGKNYRNPPVRRKQPAIEERGDEEVNPLEEDESGEQDEPPIMEPRGKRRNQGQQERSPIRDPSAEEPSDEDNKSGSNSDDDQSDQEQQDVPPSKLLSQEDSSEKESTSEEEGSDYDPDGHQ